MTRRTAFIGVAVTQVVAAVFFYWIGITFAAEFDSQGIRQPIWILLLTLAGAAAVVELVAWPISWLLLHLSRQR